MNCAESSVMSSAAQWPPNSAMHNSLPFNLTGTRGAEAAATGAQYDRLLVGYCKQLAALLGSRGLGPDRLKWEVRFVGTVVVAGQQALQAFGRHAGPVCGA